MRRSITEKFLKRFDYERARLDYFSMKKIVQAIFFLTLCSVILGCSKVDSIISAIPSGATAIFDADDVAGNGTIPAAGCSFSTWINTVFNSQNGTLSCNFGGGFAGTGIFTSPYRIEFNGNSTYVATSINAQPNVMPESTWIAWVNPSSLISGHILSIDNHAGAFNRALLIQNSNWSVFTGTATTFEAVAADVNSWQQIAVVFTASSIKLYKNGTPYSFGSAPTVNSTIQTFTIGKSAGGSFDYFTGSLNWVALYPRALTQTEITNSCKALANRFDAVICN